MARQAGRRRSGGSVCNIDISPRMRCKRRLLNPVTSKSGECVGELPHPSLTNHRHYRRGRVPEISGGPDRVIVVSNYRTIDSGALIGSCDITVVKWRFVFRGCLLFEKNGKRWLALPRKQWTDEDGNRKFTPLGEFCNPEDGRRFAAEALAAIERVIPSAASPVRTPKRSPYRPPRDGSPLPDDDVTDLFQGPGP